MRRSTRNKSSHIARRVDKQGLCSSLSNQVGVKQLATGSQSPVNNEQEAVQTSLLSNNGVNINNVTETKK